jgi:hypothetical protein
LERVKVGAIPCLDPDAHAGPPFPPAPSASRCADDWPCCWYKPPNSNCVCCACCICAPVVYWFRRLPAARRKAPTLACEDATTAGAARVAAVAASLTPVGLSPAAARAANEPGESGGDKELDGDERGRRVAAVFFVLRLFNGDTILLTCDVVSSDGSDVITVGVPPE